MEAASYNRPRRHQLPSPRMSAPPARYDHVVWIAPENHSYGQIIGASDAPYINQLASQHGLASNFYAESHPSLPNYIAMTSGSTQGIGDDDLPAAHRLDVPSIFGLLPGGGSRSLQESMPSNCLQTTRASMPCATTRRRITSTSPVTALATTFR